MEFVLLMIQVIVPLLIYMKQMMKWPLKCVLESVEMVTLGFLMRALNGSVSASVAMNQISGFYGAGLTNVTTDAPVIQIKTVEAPTQ